MNAECSLSGFSYFLTCIMYSIVRGAPVCIALLPLWRRFFIGEHNLTGFSFGIRKEGAVPLNNL